ncbi:hypothetical protein [Caulobacter hibisci]|nr:hypothetical protein [Caulobacter hibisci]
MGTKRAIMKPLFIVAGAFGVLAPLALIATTAQAQGRLKPQPIFALLSQGHLKVLTASAWSELDGLSVSGLVRRAPLWKTNVTGHLDIEAFDQAGRRLGSTSAVWRGSLGSSGHNEAARYNARLAGVNPAEVMRVAVTYHPVAHAAEPMEAAR